MFPSALCVCVCVLINLHEKHLSVWFSSRIFHVHFCDSFDFTVKSLCECVCVYSCAFFHSSFSFHFSFVHSHFFVFLFKYFNNKFSGIIIFYANIPCMRREYYSFGRDIQRKKESVKVKDIG